MSKKVIKINPIVIFIVLFLITIIGIGYYIVQLHIRELEAKKQILETYMTELQSHIGHLNSRLEKQIEKLHQINDYFYEQNQIVDRFEWMMEYDFYFDASGNVVHSPYALLKR